MNEMVLHSNDRFLKVKEVQELLNVSRSLLYRMIDLGEIPHIRINQAIRIRQSDLEEYIQEHLTI
jgi:excisionase family DNA binding protein